MSRTILITKCSAFKSTFKTISFLMSLLKLSSNMKQALQTIKALKRLLEKTMHQTESLAYNITKVGAEDYMINVCEIGEETTSARSNICNSNVEKVGKGEKSIYLFSFGRD
ncbi:unnamed protein product [Moneuplotes crassus]|uniref:Uncharacterized protein n=1 Tax=Euplotes crassus TaxID=5936 RepID=A0AAD1Y1F0_EUPCR|nr:unnamed protein product [Moneuplotes crassus]